jgi:hypothetical protein
VIAVAVAAVIAVALLLAVRAMGVALPAKPSAFDAALDRTHPPTEPVATLERAEGVVRNATANAGDAHWRLRPVLRDIAAVELHARGIDLDRDVDEARALVGEQAWELIRPDRPRPDEPFAPGIRPELLACILGALERLGT